MTDPRFFEPLGPLALAELAQLCGAQSEPAGAGRPIASAATLAHADAGSVSFFADRRLAAEAGQTAAAACFVAEASAALLPKTCAPLVSPTPHAAWALAAEQLHRPRRIAGGAPAVDPTAELEEDVSVASGAVIGAGAQIGAGTVIGPGAVVGPGVAVGGFARVGDGVKIYAGVVIGEAGYGVAVGPKGLIDVPQLGRVIIQDNVTVGAGTCIDRGAYDDTVVGENTKIDNLVQIAHNVRIGRNCIIAAHTGISGSVTLGDGVQAGGRVGIADHITIGAGARLAAAAGLMRDVPAGEEWGGIPARPAKRWLRETAWLARAAAGRKRGREDG